MKRPLFSAPDQFALAPLVALLPQLGETKKLELLSSSLFARYERARPGSNEQQMLRLILDWISSRKEG